METNRWFRTALILLSLIGALYVLGWLWDMVGRFADILLPFFLAWLLAFILYPLTDMLARLSIPWPGRARKVSHGIAALIVYVGLILVLIVLGVAVVPIVVAQAAQLGASLPAYAGKLPSLTQLQTDLNALGLPVDLNTQYQQQAILDQARQIGGTLAQNAVGIAAGVAMMAFNAMIVLILSFYFMLDGPRISKSILDIVPPSYKHEAEFFSDSITRSFGGFIRGQLLQAAVYGAGTALLMGVAGLPYIAVVATFCALAMIIPFVGPIVALVPPLLLAAVQAPSSLIWLFVALMILQQIVTNVIAPKVMSQAVGLHPLLVLFATMVGVKVAGFWGALFGVPIVAVLYATATYAYQHALAEEKTGSQHHEWVALRTASEHPSDDGKTAG